MLAADRRNHELRTERSMSSVVHAIRGSRSRSVHVQPLGRHLRHARVVWAVAASVPRTIAKSANSRRIKQSGPTM